MSPTVELLLEAVVVALVAVGMTRLLLKAPVRRELRARPLLAAAMVTVAAVGLAVLIWISLQYPLPRRALAVGLALGLVASAVRARPGYGRSRGLPPGSLGFGASLDAIEDPDYYARASERWGPIFKMRQIHQPVACITDLETGLELFRTQHHRLRQSDWAFNRLVPGGYLEYMDGEPHQRVRGLLLPGFTTEDVAATRAAIAKETRAQLTAMVAASDPSGFHPEHFLLPIAHVGLIRMILGVGPEHAEFEALRERFVDLNQPLELFLPVPQASQDAFAWLSQKVAELAGEQVSPTSVLSRVTTANPSVATDPAAIGNLVLMIKEGGIMVRGMLRWVIKMLADHPEEVKRIREAAADAAELDSRAEAFVLETIRLFESPYLYRTVASDVEVGGFRIPRGWLVRLCLAEAHALPRFFTEPKRFNQERFMNGESTEAQFCPFGAGDRACPGQDVAIEIAKTVVRETALGYDLRVVDDGPTWRINRHWGLWRPSVDLKISVIERV